MIITQQKEMDRHHYSIPESVKSTYIRNKLSMTNYL